MVDRTLRPIVPTEHTDEREHRRLLATRASASMPKDGTEGMVAPLRLHSLTAAELTGAYAASLWTGSSVYVSDEDRVATSDGTNWVRAIDTTGIDTDPGADRIVFWDDSAGQLSFLAPGTNISISGTTLNGLATPVTVANGGTGQTTEAEALGEMTQALTEDTAPDRANDFVAGYDASADTGKKVKYENVTGVAVLASGSFSGATELDLALDGYTLFKLFKLHVFGITVSTDGALLYMRFSTDGGSSFKSGASDYFWVNIITDSTPAVNPSVDISDSEMELLGGTGIGNAAGEFALTEVTIFNPAASGRTGAIHHGLRINTAGNPIQTTGSVGANTAEDTTDVRIFPSAGTFSGSYTLYGIN